MVWRVQYSLLLCFFAIRDIRSVLIQFNCFVFFCLNKSKSVSNILAPTLTPARRIISSRIFYYMQMQILQATIYLRNIIILTVMSIFLDCFESSYLNPLHHSSRVFLNKQCIRYMQCQSKPSNVVEHGANAAAKRNKRWPFFSFQNHKNANIYNK